MEIHFPTKASFSQLHMRAALEDLGISISIPDILAGVAWRETFLEVVKLHHRYRRHNLEKAFRRACMPLIQMRDVTQEHLETLR